MRGLEDKTVVLTGGASGIGAATAKRFAEEGSTVVVTDVDTDGGQAVADDIEDTGGTAEFRELDVRSYEAVESVLNAVGETYDGIDVLFNNAGIGERRSLEETDEAHRDKLIDVNLNGVWNGCRAVLPIMRASGGGAIVNTSSLAGWLPASFTTYAMTKAAVLHFTKSIAQEFGEYDIRVTAVCPGAIETPMLEEWYSEEQAEGMRRRSAVSRLGDPEEVAAGVAFLASDDASFVTGRALKIDGGFL
jgi:NAD(P)-dependent dehydrogenase (short-subunit alcohol dehydrogenase family)